jgi:hypothetical protein
VIKYHGLFEKENVDIENAFAIQSDHGRRTTRYMEMDNYTMSSLVLRNSFFKKFEVQTQPLSNYSYRIDERNWRVNDQDQLEIICPYLFTDAEERRTRSKIIEQMGQGKKNHLLLTILKQVPGLDLQLSED